MYGQGESTITTHDAIIDKMGDFCGWFGRKPEVLYLGEEEGAWIDNKAKEMTMFEDGKITEERCCGVRVVRVKLPSYIGVGD